MNQIISRLKNKNKKIKYYFYIQLIISITIILIMLIYNIIKNINEKTYKDISNQININLDINNIYNRYQTKFLGNLIIEKIDIEYPIFSEYTEENLKISVCKFSGKTLNENGNITIIGHNYKDNRFFGNLNKIDLKDEIIIKNKNNNYKYKVVKKYMTDESDLTCLNSLKKDNKEITLITCDNIAKKKSLVIKALFNQIE